MNKSTKGSSMYNEIIDWATEKYPDDQSILNKKYEQYAAEYNPIYFSQFKDNAHKISPDNWLLMVQTYIAKDAPEVNELFDIVFEDNSTCAIDVKKKLGSVYLLWISQNKSLTDSRNAYNKLMINNICDASLCKTQMNIETKQEKIDVTMIRQHFTLACMQFGKENIG